MADFRFYSSTSTSWHFILQEALVHSSVFRFIDKQPKWYTLWSPIITLRSTLKTTLRMTLRITFRITTTTTAAATTAATIIINYYLRDKSNEFHVVSPTCVPQCSRRLECTSCCRNPSIVLVRTS